MSTKIPYRAVARQPKLADQVVEQIAELIATRQLQPGDRLPPERELAEHFGVSRTVIREAMRSLVAKGLLEVRPGSGMVISAPRPSSVAESISLLLRLSTDKDPYTHVHEVRRLLEVEIAGLAAQRATAENLQDLEALIQTMERSREDPEQFAEADVEFHASLAKATQNELFSVLLDSVVDIMLEVRHMAVALPGSIDSALRHHRHILERVKAGDVEGARQAMTAHLQEAEEQMRVALARTQAGATAEPASS